MISLSHKVVVITGASSGLGKALTKHLVRHGAKVVIGARRVDRLQELAESITLDKKAVCKTDVTDPKSVQALADHAIALHGRIDVFVNNAGVLQIGMLSEPRFEEWESMIDTNIKGVLYGFAAALKHMKQQKYGHIISVSSVAGHRAFKGGAVYSATKSAVRVLSEALRQECKEWNIRSTIISPGTVQSDLPSLIKDPKESQRMKEWFNKSAIPPERFAQIVAFAIQQPEDTDINEILFRPTQED